MLNVIIIINIKIQNDICLENMSGGYGSHCCGQNLFDYVNLIFFANQYTFGFVSCLSVISSLQHIRYYISCHFSRNMLFLDIWYSSPFFKVKFDLKGEVGDNGIGGGVRRLFASSCTKYHWTHQFPTKIFEKNAYAKVWTFSKTLKCLATTLTLFILISFYWA